MSFTLGGLAALPAAADPAEPPAATDPADPTATEDPTTAPEPIDPETTEPSETDTPEASVGEPEELPTPEEAAAEALAAGELATVVATGPEAITTSQVMGGGMRSLAVTNDVIIDSGAGGSTVRVKTADPAATIKAMQASGLYSGVALDQVVRADALPTPTDPWYGSFQSELKNGQGNSAWTASTSVGSRFNLAWPKVGGASTSTTIAVVDSGFPQTNHADLNGSHIQLKFDTGDNDSNARYNGSTSDGALHGAEVTSVIGALVNNSNTGMVGAAQDTRVFFYKTVRDEDRYMASPDIYLSAVAAAVRRATSDGAKVINLSLGGPCMAQKNWPLDPAYAAIQDAVKKGVTVVAAAGNSYGTALQCPASYPGVISVGATNPNGTKASFSTYNSAVDISAPGVSITTVSTPTGDYPGGRRANQGTSFSSPLVAAAAGLLKRTNTALTPGQITNILCYTAQDAGTYGKDTSFGYGILDAGRALDFASNPNGVKNPFATFTAPTKQVILSPDLTGDGRGDLLIVDSSRTTLKGVTSNKAKLLLYAGKADGSIVSTPIIMGQGWDSTTIFAPGDWSGDGKADVIGRNPSGLLYLYKGNGKGGFTGATTEIGHGWGAFSSVVPAGDLTGDRKNDLLAVDKNDGKMYLYRGNGKGGFYAGKREVGHGWKDSVMGLYAAGDIDGNGTRDILGIQKSTGKLYRYMGNGKGGFGAKKEAGHGWGGAMKLAAGASLDGDRYADIVGIAPDHRLLYYKGKGLKGFSSSKKIGQGF